MSYRALDAVASLVISRRRKPARNARRRVGDVDADQTLFFCHHRLFVSVTIRQR